MTRTAGARIGCQRPSRFWGLGCPKIYHEVEDTLVIAQYRKTGRLSRQQRTTAGFKRLYTDRDIRLLAEMDERHDTPCGHAIKKLCERAYQVFGRNAGRHLC